MKRQINPKFQIDGILLTMVDNRTNFAKEIAALLRDTYGSKIKVFGTEIPHSVRAKEITVMSNHHLRNANLSLKAKGLLSMMLSLPEDWNYTTRGLAKICKEGVDAIGAVLWELI